MTLRLLVLPTAVDRRKKVLRAERQGALHIIFLVRFLQRHRKIAQGAHGAWRPTIVVCTGDENATKNGTLFASVRNVTRRPQYFPTERVITTIQTRRLFRMAPLPLLWWYTRLECHAGHLSCDEMVVYNTVAAASLTAPAQMRQHEAGCAHGRTGQVLQHLPSKNKARPPSSLSASTTDERCTTMLSQPALLQQHQVNTISTSSFPLHTTKSSVKASEAPAIWLSGHSSQLATKGETTPGMCTGQLYRSDCDADPPARPSPLTPVATTRERVRPLWQFESGSGYIYLHR